MPREATKTDLWPKCVHRPPWNVREDEGEAFVIAKSGHGWYDNVADETANPETAGIIAAAVNAMDTVGVVLDDDRLSYVEVQIDRAAWLRWKEAIGADP